MIWNKYFHISGGIKFGGSEMHPSKEPFPIWATEGGIMTFFNDEQFFKALTPMFVREGGMIRINLKHHSK